MKKLALVILSCVVLQGAELRAAESEDKLPSVEDAAREFRILTYDTFRLNRTEYDARREAADQLFEAWQAAREPRDFRDAVSGWFVEATALTQFDPTTELPPVPELPAVSSASHTMDSFPSLHIEMPPETERPAYLDPDAIRALDQDGQLLGPEDEPAPAENDAMSTILNGLKRAILGDE